MYLWKIHIFDIEYRRIGELAYKKINTRSSSFFILTSSDVASPAVKPLEVGVLICQIKKLEDRVIITLILAGFNTLVMADNVKPNPGRVCLTVDTEKKIYTVEGTSFQEDCFSKQDI